jgi:hypothetical protein
LSATDEKTKNVLPTFRDNAKFSILIWSIFKHEAPHFNAKSSIVPVESMIEQKAYFLEHR